MRHRYGMGVPRFRTPTTVRLERELKELQELRAQSTILEFEADGDQPTHYRMKFHGKCLVPATDGAKIGDLQEFSIRLGGEFPRRAPEIRWETPIAHPNISGTSVCTGNFAANWTPSFHLTDLVEVLWDMVRMAVFNVHGGYKVDRSWERLDQEYHFPVDRRPLRDKVLPNNAGSSIVRPDGGEDDILIIDDDKGCQLGCGLGGIHPEDRVDADLELRMARNMFGPLSQDLRRRLQAVLDEPNQQTWTDAHSIIVGANRFMTLWQAVIEIDPTFPAVGPSTDRKGLVVKGWKRIPDRDLLVRALKFATH